MGMPFPVSGAVVQAASTGKVFRGKYRSAGEDDFSRKPQGQTLPVEPGGLRPLPANRNGAVISFSGLFRLSGTRGPG